jgi:hypothetical protein
MELSDHDAVAWVRPPSLLPIGVAPTNVAIALALLKAG